MELKLLKRNDDLLFFEKKDLTYEYLCYMLAHKVIPFIPTIDNNSLFTNNFAGVVSTKISVAKILTNHIIHYAKPQLREDITAIIDGAFTYESIYELSIDPVSLQSLNLLYDESGFEWVNDIPYVKSAGLKIIYGNAFIFGYYVNKEFIFTGKDGVMSSEDVGHVLQSAREVHIIGQENRLSIKIKKCYKPIGIIDLSGFHLTEKDSLNKIKQKCVDIGVPIVTKMAKNELLFKYYEQINKIAGATPFSSFLPSETQPIFLIGFDSNAAKEIRQPVNRFSMQESFSAIARKNGKLVTDGNPMFTEQTLAGESVWYACVLKDPVSISE